MKALIESDQKAVEEAIQNQKQQDHKDRMYQIAHRGQKNVKVTTKREVSEIPSMQVLNIVAI